MGQRGTVWSRHGDKAAGFPNRLPIGFDPTILIGAIAAVVGGVVVYGSNSSTSEQNMAAMKDAEACKAELIGHDQSSGGGCPAGWTFTLIRTRSPPPTNDDEQRERRSLGLKLWVGRRHDKNFEPRPARWSLLVGGEGAKSCGPNGTPQPR